MAAKTTLPTVPTPAVLTQDPNAANKVFGGASFADFNTVVLHQTQATVWAGNAKTTEEKISLALSAAGGLAAIEPRDAVEGMLAAQMVATHNAAMECYRRAMIAAQTAVGRECNLTQANKLTRSYTTLVQALDKHRGKGQQTVRVEHVHVYDGGQAIVGSVSAPDRISSVDFNGRMETIADAVLAPGGSH